MLVVKRTVKSKQPRGFAEYTSLIRAFPLMPITSDRAYRAAARALDRLAVMGESKLQRWPRAYFEVLTLLVREYDKANMPPCFRLQDVDGTPTITRIHGRDRLKHERRGKVRVLKGGRRRASNRVPD